MQAGLTTLLGVVLWGVALIAPGTVGATLAVIGTGVVVTGAVMGAQQAIVEAIKAQAMKPGG